MKINTYKGVGSLTFGAPFDSARQVFGAPGRSSLRSGVQFDSWSHLGLKVMSRSGLISEVGLNSRAKPVIINDIDLFGDPGPKVHGAICALDGAPFEGVGFTVLFELGITLTGFREHTEKHDPRTVTVFSKGLWDSVELRSLPREDW